MPMDALLFADFKNLRKEVLPLAEGLINTNETYKLYEAFLLLAYCVIFLCHAGRLFYLLNCAKGARLLCEGDSSRRYHFTGTICLSWKVCFEQKVSFYFIFQFDFIQVVNKYKVFCRKFLFCTI